MSDFLLNRATAARMLCVSVATVDRMVAAGTLRAIRLGRAVRLPVAELKRLSSVPHVATQRRARRAR
jgi:excisionase family DNA binding protein